MVYSQLFSIVIKQFTYCVKVLITRSLWLTVIVYTNRNLQVSLAGIHTIKAKREPEWGMKFT